MRQRSKLLWSTGSATFGFALGIFGLFYLTKSVNFDVVFAAVPDIANTQLTFLWREWNAAECFGVPAVHWRDGKSAQLFLHTWLPDAMEGPTPVSALDPRCDDGHRWRFPGLPHVAPHGIRSQATAFITVIGATTAFFAATVGLVQTDIKRVIAYSTCSQLGYMFVAAGVGMYSAAMFHLFTHAFFQGDAVLGGRVSDPCAAPRTRHDELWRVAEKDPLYLLGDDDRHSGNHWCWYPFDPYRFRRVPFQRCDH